MSTNFLRPGDTFEHTATATFTKGQGYVVGNVFGVSANSGVSGDTQVLVRVGVHSLDIDAGFSPAKGDKVFWDDTAKALKASAAGYFLVGTAEKVKASGKLETRLDGIQVTAV